MSPPLLGLLRSSGGSKFPTRGTEKIRSTYSALPVPSFSLTERMISYMTYV